MPEDKEKTPQKEELLKFNVAQLLKQSGDPSRTYTIVNAILPGADDDLSLLSPLHGTIKLTRVDREVLANGTLSTTIELACTRCLTPVEAPITIELEETFTPTTDVHSGGSVSVPEDVDEAALIDETHMLDMTEVVRQNIHLNEPVQILCKPDCLGLCLVCGEDKNLGECSCSTEKIDSRWAELAALKDKFNE